MRNPQQQAADLAQPTATMLHTHWGRARAFSVPAVIATALLVSGYAPGPGREPAGRAAYRPTAATVYVANFNGSVTPINAVTNTPGKPIKIVGATIQFLSTPDGSLRRLRFRGEAGPDLDGHQYGRHPDQGRDLRRGLPGDGYHA